MDLTAVRAQFPALARTVAGAPAVYLDGPGGTQVPQSVIDAMRDFMERGGSNHGGSFVTSEETDRIAATAREALADLFGSSPAEVAFGQNMTSLTFAMSRALARAWRPGDQVVVTRLDHDANITPWVLAARDAGAEVIWIDFDPGDCTLDMAELAAKLGPRTRLVAVTAASNAVGTVVDIAEVAQMTHAAGALLYVDAVHYAPHYRLDVAVWDCDFLVASAYKFFGPHTGAVFGKAEHLESLEAYKVRPAPATGPGKWETGTQSFESLAGVTAAVDYLAAAGEGPDRPSRLTAAFDLIGAHEERLGDRFLAGAAEIPGLRVYGVVDGRAPRTPTFAVAVEGMDPRAVATELGEQGIFVWSGHYYAVAVMDRLGLEDSGGLVRIGFVHYNTIDEVDRVLNALAGLAARAVS